MFDFIRNVLACIGGVYVLGLVVMIALEIEDRYF